ncbi:MAG: DUF6788 family protein, partial [Terriglobia bacterium]
GGNFSLSPELIRSLPPLDEIIRGSLIERYKRCGKQTCWCATEKGHGPKYYLSVSRPGASRPEMDYVPQEYKEQVDSLLSNYKLVRDIFEEICSINRELLSRREEL